MDDEDRCDQCGSTDFTVEDDGHTYCANGHEQARGAIIAEDDGDFARQGKVVRKKEKKSKQKVSKGEWNWAGVIVVIIIIIPPRLYKQKHSSCCPGWMVLRGGKSSLHLMIRFTYTP